MAGQEREPRAHSDGGASVRLAELAASFSLASDITLGQPMEHALRACLLAVSLGEAAGLEEPALVTVYYVALIRGVGCIADAHQLGQWFGDEIGAWADVATLDPLSRPAMIQFVAQHLGAGQPLGRRLGMLAGAATRLPKAARELFGAHAELAQRMADALDLGPEVQRALGHAYELWDGRGFPAGVRGEAIAPAARLAKLANDAEIVHRLDGVDAAVAAVRQRAGRLYDPALAEVFCRQAPRLLPRLPATSIWDATVAAEPGPRPRLTPQQLDRAARTGADFVDLRSPFTLGHSSGVADLAAAAAGRLALSDDEVRLVRCAGWLHDLGRAGVPAGLWDKAGPLTEGEWERVRLHPYFTERMLARPAALARAGALAALHHERLDGSGYHRGARSAQIPILARLLAAADAYHAMTEPRPYRPERSADEAAAELRREVRQGRIDGDAAVAVLAAAGQSSGPAHSRRQRTWPAGLTDREIEVLELLARGLSNRQIGRRLCVTPKTAGNHVQHIFEKVGVSSRAAAALFAAQYDLVGPAGGLDRPTARAASDAARSAAK